MQKLKRHILAGGEYLLRDYRSLSLIILYLNILLTQTPTFLSTSEQKDAAARPIPVTILMKYLLPKSLTLTEQV